MVGRRDDGLLHWIYRPVRALLIAAFFLVLLGCEGTTVMRGRSQREALEIVALLNSHGISASMKLDAGSRDRFQIEVDSSYISQAIDLLQKTGHPKDPESTFGELIAPQGIIPNSREIESLRLDRAIAVELEEMLRATPGVASVRAIVRLNYSRNDSKAGVSVTIQQKGGFVVDPAPVQEIVLRAVPGIEPENISVKILPEESIGEIRVDEGVLNDNGRVIRKPLVPFLWYYVPEDSYTRLALSIFGFMALVLVVGAIGGYWYGYYRRLRGFFETDLSEPIVSKPLKSEKMRRDLPGV